MLAGFGEQFALEQDHAFKLGRGFGSGMGTGGLCGAVTGSFMILGYLAGDDADERRARFRTYDLVAEFSRQFEARRGTLVCKSLLGGIDVGTEAGRKEALQRNVFREICPGIVRDAGEILEDLTARSKHNAPLA